jgi:hypothetical protein
LRRFYRKRQTPSSKFLITADRIGILEDNDANDANLAILRCCLLAIKATRLNHLSWPQVIETAQVDQAFAYQLIANYRLK